MADARLRQLEREALSGDDTAMAALLRERARVGLLDLVHLELAAWLGDQHARMAMDSPPPPEPGVQLTEPTRRGVRHGVARTAPLSSLLKDKPFAFKSRIPVKYSSLCGRKLKPEQVTDDHGTPVCRRCLATDAWRRARNGHLREVVDTLTNRLPLAGVRAALAVVEAMLPRYLSTLEGRGALNVGGGAREIEGDLLRYRDLLAWVRHPDRPSPPPRTEPDPWDPAGIYVGGVSAWVYGLCCAALDIRHGKAPINCGQVASLAVDWAVDVTDANETISEARENIRARLVPWLLHDEDPLGAVQQDVETRVIPHYRETAWRR